MGNDVYIKQADAVFAVQKRIEQIGMENNPYLCSIRQAVRDVPAADVEPVKHGHWIMYAYDEAICSECGYDRGTEFESTKEAKERWDELPMWCEGCGAKMDGEETGDDEE